MQFDWVGLNVVAFILTCHTSCVAKFYHYTLSFLNRNKSLIITSVYRRYYVVKVVIAKSDLPVCSAELSKFKSD